MKYYWGSDIKVAESCRGFFGDRNFHLTIEVDGHSDDESLEVRLPVSEDELRKLMKQIQDVLEADQ